MTDSEKQFGRKSVRLKVTPRVAHIVSGRGGRDEQWKAVRGELDLSDLERFTLLVYFAQSKDAELTRAARQILDGFPAEGLRSLASDASLHPALLVFLARRYARRHGLHDLLVTNPSLPESLRRSLESAAQKSGSELSDDEASSSTDDKPDDRTGRGEAAQEEQQSEEESESDEPEAPENLSKFQMTMHMGVAEKIKAAMTGDKEWRGLLIGDTNKLVSSAVLKNPRITEKEVQTIARNKATNEELIRIIMLNREWMKIYSIKLALVMHPRTPLGNALRFMGGLTEKDLKNLGKSREVSPVISNNARRLLMAKAKNR
jgi:hypothetical protein